MKSKSIYLFIYTYHFHAFNEIKALLIPKYMSTFLDYCRSVMYMNLCKSALGVKPKSLDTRPYASLVALILIFVAFALNSALIFLALAFASPLISVIYLSATDSSVSVLAPC